MAETDGSLWVSMAQALFHDLKPMGAGPEWSGKGMCKSEHAFLVHRETKRVNSALIAMSLADDENEVHRIFNELSKDTVIALFSRWAHYYREWRKLEQEGELHPWIPLNKRDIWRAILLAMTDDLPAATAAGKQLWPEDFRE